MTTSVLVSFDCLGFEAIVDLTDTLDQAVMAALMDEPGPKDPSFHIIMRAKANPQRFPEVYALTLDNSVPFEDFKELCMSEPQLMADTVRQSGVCLFKTAREKSVIV